MINCGNLTLKIGCRLIHAAGCPEARVAAVHNHLYFVILKGAGILRGKMNKVPREAFIVGAGGGSKDYNLWVGVS